MKIKGRLFAAIAVVFCVSIFCEALASAQTISGCLYQIKGRGRWARWAKYFGGATVTVYLSNSDTVLTDTTTSSDNCYSISVSSGQTPYLLEVLFPIKGRISGLTFNVTRQRLLPQNTANISTLTYDFVAPNSRRFK
ncbi:MAG: hypothetical protein D6808_00085 [Candidatus Dadabacteria bacterium]|nr:MAG: hypothetical protein D6808_00085 [Candidatus Dadabacteria bacterium]